MTKRTLVFLSVAVPVAALFALFAWALVRSGGNPGGLLVNSELGEVSVREAQSVGFSLETFSGESLQLSDLRGKVVMLDFWSSWCPPCRQEAPALVRAYEIYRERGVEFVGIAIWDSDSAARRFLERYGVTYPNGPDERGRIAVDHGVRGIPEKLFVDRDGRLVRKFIGPMTTEELGAVLEEMLAR